jgi:hypothetical protein
MTTPDDLPSERDAFEAWLVRDFGPNYPAQWSLEAVEGMCYAWQARAALAAAPAAPEQPARTLLEQYDLDQSADYRKGYEDGRLKGFEVGQRYAREAPEQPAYEPLRRADGTTFIDDLLAAAPAQPAEPVAWIAPDDSLRIDEGQGEPPCNDWRPLYTAAPQPQPLTDDDILRLWSGDTTPKPRPVMGRTKVLAFARAVLAASQEQPK